MMSKTTKQKDLYKHVQAVVYAYHEDDADMENPPIYEIVLVNQRTEEIPMGSGDIQIVTTSDDNSVLFDAVMKAVANHDGTFEVEHDHKVNRYELISAEHINKALAAQYQKPIDVDWTKAKEFHTVTFYYRSNKCFRQKHSCTACRVKLLPADSNRKPILVDAIRCDECQKYFMTKEMLAARGGCYEYWIKPEFDDSMSEDDKWLVKFGYSTGFISDDFFDDFAKSTSIHDAGYTTRKPATVRQSILKSLIDGGRFTKERIIQYLHEQYLDTGFHGEEATRRAREDLSFILEEYNTDADGIILGKLERP